MKKFLVFSLAVFLFLFASQQPTLASAEFETRNETQYQIASNGQVNVTQNIFLTNKLANIYATQYSFSLQSVKIANITAQDDYGPLELTVKESDESTLIDLSFNQPVVGKGKTLHFTLNYEALDLAQKRGQIWEINLPRFSEKNPPDSFQVTLAVANSLGQLAFIRPKPDQENETNGFKIYHFTQSQLLSQGINASFGEFQIFDFVLNYHLQNPYHTKRETSLALPPDTAFQQVIYRQIKPEPLNVIPDDDGNWLAQYQLEGDEKLNISAIGQVKIFSQPRQNYFIPSHQSIQNNLLSQPHWPIDEPLIQSQAQKLKDPQAIYNFVVDYLQYDFDRVEEGSQRLGGLAALQNPNQAICTEFTDLFISLARANRLPSREINGFAYTTNAKIRPLDLVSDVLHAWPEYWDQNQRIWMPIDPTWGSTTNGVDYFSRIDLNHFVFVIHGEKDDHPYPPGSYKLNNNQSKDVQVVFGQYPEAEKPKIDVQFNLPGTIIVQNKGNAALYHLQIKIAPYDLEININWLPPYGQKEIVLPKPTPFLKNLFQPRAKIITVAVNQQKFSQSAPNSFTHQQFFWPLLLGILLIGMIFFLTKIIRYARK